jgi:hypothetical protein
MPGARRIRRLVNQALSAKGQTKKLACGALPDWNVHDVGHQTGCDLRGFSRVMTSSAVIHALKSHGNKARESARKPPQAAISKADIGRLGKIISSAHAIEFRPGANGRAASLLYTARVGRFDYRYVETIGFKKSQVAFKSLWKSRI